MQPGQLVDDMDGDRRSISHAVFAKMIGMDRSYYTSIEVGKRNDTLQNFAKIAHGFDMTISELLEGID